jgi:hypothetical protein
VTNAREARRALTDHRVLNRRRRRSPKSMPESPALTDLLACPRCDRALAKTDAGLRCEGCRVDFPSIGAIPWLFAEPNAALAEWRARLNFALAKLERAHSELESAARAAGLAALTRTRLEGLAAATADHAARLRDLLAPLALEAPATRYETYLALRTRLPPDQGLTTYYANVHRDWAWGEEENKASADIVAAALGDAPPGRMLVLGAGAGRLAYDLHRRTNATLTVALDFNPLLALAAERVMRGTPIELYEFPLAPVDLEHQAMLRTLAAPMPVDDRFHYVLADAHRPPFARGSFDTVVTPWLIDILPEPFETFCTRINALLADGGRWINFGSLSFHAPEPALRLSREECLAIVADTGFSTPSVREETIPYMCSPASRHGRRERVLCFAATKERKAKRPPRYEALPDWLVRGKDPVPLNDSFRSQAAATRVHAFIMSLIDGRRSLADMAQVFVDQRLMGRDEAEAAIRGFLTKMYDDSRRGSGY